MSSKTGSKGKGGGATVLSKQKIYAKIAMSSTEIVEGILKLSKSKNESVRLGALKVLINKIVPDLRSVEAKVEGEIVVGLMLKVPPKNDK